jgi:COP9 signalosome complex subunit 6
MMLKSVIGALLGTQVNREVSVVNSFELTYSSRNTVADVVMSEGSAASNMGRYVIDNDFFEKRKEQCSLTDHGWSDR